MPDQEHRTPPEEQHPFEAWTTTSARDVHRERSFDALAKGLAEGTVSRRGALRWIGAAILGGVLASIPGMALAQPGGRGRPTTPGGSRGCPAGCQRLVLANGGTGCGSGGVAECATSCTECGT